MFLSKLSLKRPVMMTMLIMVLVVFGFMAYFTMPLNTMPDIKIPYVIIQTIYPGAGPLEIEQQITIPIEDAIATISHIQSIESYSMDNLSLIQITFSSNKDINLANQEVKDNVDTIVNNLPVDADKPIVRKIDIAAMPVIGLVLSGHQDALELFEYAEKTLKDRFAQIPGVAQVDVSGGQRREIHVVLDDRTVFSNNISLPGLGQTIASQNYSMPAGSFKAGNQDLSVSIKGEILDLSAFRDLEVSTPFGIKKLSQIANVQDTGNLVTERTTFFDVKTGTKHNNVVAIDIVKSSDGNAVGIAHAFKKMLPSVSRDLPQGMELTIINDSSEFVESSVNDTISNVFLGILFTSLLLFFFLHDYRSTLIIVLSMPISIIATFMLMQIAGFTLNIMSLMGLSTSVGILVVNSVIVLENIFRFKAKGYSSKEAADKGTTETTVAVLAASLTNLVVFIPIGSMKGMGGQMLGEFALTVVFATILSIITAFTITPMLASIILPEKPRQNKFGETIEKFFDFITNAYRSVLQILLAKKRNSLIVILSTLFLFITSLYIFTKIGFEFSPNMDQGTATMRVELPIGYHLDETALVLAEIESIIANYQEVEYIRTILGQHSRTSKGMNYSTSDIKLVDKALRNASTEQITDRMIRDLAHIPNAKIIVEGRSSMGPGGATPINLFVSGPDNDILMQITNEIMDKIKDIPGLINLDSTTRSGKPEITITPKRDQMALTGNNVMELAIGVRAAVAGIVSTTYKESGNEYDIVVTLEEGVYNTPEKMKNLTIITSKGKFQLGQLADVEFSEGVNRIIRRDKAKTISISGSNASGVPLGNITGEMERIITEMNLPEGYTTNWGGSAEMMNEVVSEMMKAAIIAILLLYMLLAAILESFKQPFLMLSTIPLALIGVFMIQYLSGMTMNFVSMMSIVMLIGIVVNNGILILDYTNLLVCENKNIKEALLEACSVKLKPILMSNIAIVLGMLPMALGIGDAGSEIRQSMGIVSIGGVIMSALLSLLVIPALHYFTSKTKVNIV